MRNEGLTPFVRIRWLRTDQTCLAHLLWRYRELISDGVAGQAETPACHSARRVCQGLGGNRTWGRWSASRASVREDALKSI